MLIKQIYPHSEPDLAFFYAISTDNYGTLKNGLTWIMNYDDSFVIYKD